VGLEFAQAHRRFGARVTIIQHGAQLVPGHDPDVAAELLRILTGEGIEIVMPAEIVNVRGRSGSSVSLIVKKNGVERTIEASDILVAAGRVPNTAGMGLELAGVKLDPRGYIKVNERLETTAANVWAMGECAGSPQFTHVSYDDFRIVRDNFAGKKRTTADRVVPSCLFTDPQVAQIGLTETEARRLGVAVRVATLPVANVLRAHTVDEKDGFLKVLVAATDDRILGFVMIGPEAGEVLAVVQTAMIAGLPFTALRDAILTHPTMAEGLNVLFSRVKPIAAS
jgi:pyruvate/2-oxoglutarate dehydrogenase complex dihydrolipoamide dehydrogenase (E3) component